MPQEYTEKGERSVSEQQLSDKNSNSYTLVFITVLSIIAAIILSLLASVLEAPKVVAKDLDRSRQMMIAANILDREGSFLIDDGKGKPKKARLENGKLVAKSVDNIATQEQLLGIYKDRLQPLLVDSAGKLTTFEAAHINEQEYVSAHRKMGYYKQPLKLIYKILPQEKNNSDKELYANAAGWVIPVNGFGLWDAIYGYLAIASDGITVLGMTWYDHKETPGLGANIADAYWQEFFPGKKIFQQDASGNIDLNTAPLGITVVRGKVSEVYGSSSKANSAIDGMAGATLTGNGVTDAYTDVLKAYRPFLKHVNASYSTNKKEATS